MKCRHFFTLLLLFQFSISPAQQRISDFGFPEIRNYSPKDYQGHAQTWEINQKSNGMLYVGTSEGVLEYDGRIWNKIKLPNLSRVKALESYKDVIYCGGSGEFGFLAQDSTGASVYVSLLEKLGGELIGYPQQIIAFDDTVHYVTHHQILSFSVESSTLKVHNLQGSKYLFPFQDQLMLYHDKTIKVLGSETTLIKAPLVQGHSVLNSDLFLLSNDGVYLFDGRFHKLKTPSKVSFERTSDIIAIDEERMAILSDRVYIVNKRGQLIMTLQESDGLADVNLHHGYVDQKGALWLSGNFGLSRVELHKPIARFDERNGLFDTINDIIRFGEHLYVSTHTDLYRMDANGQFEAVSDKVGESFALEIIHGELWVSTYEGIYSSVDGVHFQQRSPDYAYKIQQSVADPSLVFVGSTTGLVLLKKESDLYRRTSLQDQFPYDARYMNQDTSGILWIGTNDNRLLRFDFFEEGDFGQPKMEEFGTTDGLPNSHIQVNRVGDELIFSSEYGIYDYIHPEFIESTRFPSLPTIVYYLYLASDQTIYTLWGEPPFMRIYPFIYDREAEKFDVRDLPALRSVESTGIWVAYEDFDGSIWLGLSDGLLHYRPETSLQDAEPSMTNIGRISLNTDSLVFSHQQSGHLADIPYQDNSIRFDYSIVAFDQAENNQYSYRLVGLSDQWSDWSKDHSKEYVDLSEGEYTFEVKGRDVYGVEGTTASFFFEIRPPWYRTWYFLTAVAIGAIAFIVLVVRFFSTRKLIRRVEELELAQELQNERERISRDLHDSVGTHFAYIISKLDYLYLGWNKGDLKEKQNYLGAVTDFARSGMRMLRETIWALNESEVDANSLKSKISDYLKLCFSNETINYDFEFKSETGKINSSIALNCFRIVQEGVSNSLKHSLANHIEIKVEFDVTGKPGMKISDDGKGFEIAEGLEKSSHYGLGNMQKRAEEMNLTYEIKSGNNGTAILID